MSVCERPNRVELKVIERVGLLRGELVDEFFVRHLRFECTVGVLSPAQAEVRRTRDVSVG